MPNESLVNAIASIIKRHIHMYGSDDIVALMIDCLSVDILCSDPEKSSSSYLHPLVYGPVLTDDMIIDSSAQIIERVESIIPSFKFMAINGNMSLFFLPIDTKYNIEDGGDGALMIEYPTRPQQYIYLDDIYDPSDAFWKLIEDNNAVLEALKTYKHAPHERMSKQVINKMEEYYSSLSDSDKLIYELDI